MPTVFNSELDKQLASLVEQWNVAERRIKKAEHVRAKQVVSAAIFELRYAGRKLIEVIEIALRDDFNSLPDLHAQMFRSLSDATEDCVKSKHDAIDAMIDFVTRWFHDLEELVGLEELQSLFPDYLNTVGRIDGIQEQIEESRQRRGQRRDGIYDIIEQSGYNEVLDLFNRMRLSRERVELIVSNGERKNGEGGERR